MKETSNLNSDEQPLRLFESDFLEFFTHINPLVVLILFTSIIVYFLWVGVKANPGTLWWRVAVTWLMGIFIWSPVEYILHRFVFHFSPKNPSDKTKRFLFLMHGVHHAQPREKTRLVMPPVVSIPLAAFFLLIFHFFFGKLFGLEFAVSGLFAGFATGYLVYDLTHYALHHFSMSGDYFRKLRQHHMGHHFKTHDAKYGVSTWLWDEIFHTM
ncbi:MAG: sterol desaturase family protein [Anaerolineaceae bacterium]|nr:sterol desaturase family protein [Anaerolineaceae bacterium]